MKEYWLVHPEEQTVIAYFLNEKGKYELQRTTPFTANEKVQVKVFKGFEVNLVEVFEGL